MSICGFPSLLEKVSWMVRPGTAMVPFVRLFPPGFSGGSNRGDGKDTLSQCFFLLLSEQLFLFQVPCSHTLTG